MSPAAGRLVLVATPIGNMADMSPRAMSALAEADIVCCEDTRHSGLLLSRLGVAAKRLVSLNAHNEAEKAPWLLGVMAGGAVVALVSDAGTPAVSDPGERLVALAAENGLTVTSVPGPSAVLAGLVVSGMGLSRWRFEGFLPRKGPERRALLAEIAAAPCPSVCFESPHRVAATLADLAAACGEGRRVAVCRELTKLHEETFRGTLGEAAARFAAAPVRGELVVVVAGSDPPSPAESDVAGLHSAVGSLMAKGLSRRDAVRQVAIDKGLPRSTVYAAAIAEVPSL
ncbi:MAG: 16S rRNA (cytidine(1402)-2'-O)-methyltransferase [Acidimicrobiales bacterium]